MIGDGDLISNFFEPPAEDSVPYVFRHSGEDVFRVLLRCEDGMSEQVVLDRSGPIEETEPISIDFPNGLCLWDVRADGEWVIEQVGG